VYSVGIGTEAARRVIETGSRRVAPRRRRAPRLIGELTDVRPFGVHRMAFLGAPVAFVLLASGGVAVKAQISHPQLVVRTAPAAVKTVEPGPERADVPPPVEKVAAPVPAATPIAAAAPAPQASESAKPPALTPAQRAVRREAQAARSAPAPAAQTAAQSASGGVVQLAILPWGEVYVNGKSRGVSPPLRSVELPPGTHTIELRNTSFPTHTQRVEVRAGEPVRIRHRFH
jgi:hypothetical protein